MKRIATAFIVLAAAASFVGQVWAHGMGGGFARGGFSAHRGGNHFSSGSGPASGFYSGFAQSGPRMRFGSPQFQPQGMGHFDHFQHEQFFVPHPHFGQGGFAFHSFGFSGGGFVFVDHFGPAGPPPLGAPGPLPLGAPGRVSFIPLGPPVVVISAPFFCFPHGLGFTDQMLFLDHLWQFHGIPPRDAFSHCMPLGDTSRWIFFGL